MDNFIGSTYNKESVEEFLQNNKDLYKIELNDIYNLLIKVFACSLSSRRIKLKIKTTDYVSSIFKKNGHNFNAAFITIILNIYNDGIINDISSIIKNSNNREINTIVNKYISLDVLKVINNFLPLNNRNIIIDNIGILFDYYYVIKR